MRSFFTTVCAFVCLSVLIFSFSSCSKKNDEEPLVITPTVNPLPHSVLIYLITPTDRSFNADYYRAAKACILNVQNWYKSQLGSKTFIINPVVVDTITGLHDAIWYDSYNGDSISSQGPSYAYYNTKYELQQLLGARYDTIGHPYFAFVVSDFPEETIPGRLGVEGSSNLDGLLSKFPDSWKGSVAHAMGHAFGLIDDKPDNDHLVMSTGRFKYPNCVLSQSEIDTLNVSPFFQIH